LPIKSTLAVQLLAFQLQLPTTTKTTSTDPKKTHVKKQGSPSTSSSSSSSSSGSGGGTSDGGGGSGGGIHHVKIKKVKKPDISGSTNPGGTIGSTSSTTGTDTTTTGGGGGGSINGSPGGNGGTNGQVGTGGTTGVINSPSGGGSNSPPIKCKSNEILKGDICVPNDIINTPNPPTTCKDTEVLKNGVCVPKQTTDCSNTPGLPECVPCPTGQHKDPSTNKCVPDVVTCNPPKTMVNGQCVEPSICPSHEHFDNNLKKCVRDPRIPRSGPISIHINVRNTVVIRQSTQLGVPGTVVHDFIEFTANPTNSKVVIRLPTQNIQDAITKNINMFGTILNTGFGTARNIGEVKSTIFDKRNNTLATLTAIPETQTPRTQSTTTYQLVISPDLVRLTDIKYIEFELVPLRTGGASVASSSSC
jgi:hypothetical protein